MSERERKDRESDDELIAQYQLGRAGAFDRLLERHQGPLLGYLVRMTGNRETAEDLFQETFLRVLRALPRYEGRGRWKAWLYRTAGNLCIDHFRRSGRRPSVPLDGHPDGEGRLSDVLADGSPAPDRVAGEARFLAALESAMAGLPEKQREVYLLRTVSGLSFREIAEALDCPLGTALGRMHDALARLRAELGEEWLHELLDE